MKAAFVFAIVLACLAPPADARYLERAIANDHLQWSCDVVRYFRAHYSEDELKAKAKEYGVTLSPRQQAEARACFKK